MRNVSFLVLRGITEQSLDIMTVLGLTIVNSGLTQKSNTGLRLSAKIIESILFSHKGAMNMVSATDNAQMDMLYMCVYTITAASNISQKDLVSAND